MTADVSQDRRVTAIRPGWSTRFVDGSRLCWASPSPCMKDWGTGFSSRTGYKVMRCFRMRYLQPSPGSRSSSNTIDRPDHQASHRARRRQGVAWTRRSL